jgi:hypothetical protein
LVLAGGKPSKGPKDVTATVLEFDPAFGATDDSTSGVWKHGGSGAWRKLPPMKRAKAGAVGIAIDRA